MNGVFVVVMIALHKVHVSVCLLTVLLFHMFLVMRGKLVKTGRTALLFVRCMGCVVVSCQFRSAACVVKGGRY